MPIFSETILRKAFFAAIIAASIVIGLYFYRFHDSLSGVSQDWANFGSYVGGTLSPIFALLAFLSALANFRELKLQEQKSSVLEAIRSYEKDLLATYSLLVTCDTPWIWGHEFSASEHIKELPLRPLLKSDSLDWGTHLIQLRDGLNFRTQPDGTFFQDRDIWLMAQNAIEGLFKYLALYENIDGDQSIIDYYKSTYEVPKNRLSSASWAGALKDEFEENHA